MQNADADSGVVPQVTTVRSIAIGRFALCLHSAFCILNCAGTANAQQLIDRVLARVGPTAVTMTDVRIALELGLVQVSGDDRQAVAL